MIRKVYLEDKDVRERRREFVIDVAAIRAGVRLCRFVKECRITFVENVGDVMKREMVYEVGKVSRFRAKGESQITNDNVNVGVDSKIEEVCPKGFTFTLFGWSINCEHIEGILMRRNRKSEKKSSWFDQMSGVEDVIKTIDENDCNALFWVFVLINGER